MQVPVLKYYHSTSLFTVRCITEGPSHRCLTRHYDYLDLPFQRDGIIHGYDAVVEATAQAGLQKPE